MSLPGAGRRQWGDDLSAGVVPDLAARWRTAGSRRTRGAGRAVAAGRAARPRGVRPRAPAGRGVPRPGHRAGRSARPAWTGGRHPLPDPAALQRALRAAGVRGERPVVVYDADNGSIAARAWWLLRWAGHGDVSVLDGGFAAWEAEGRPVTTAVPEPEPGDFTARPGGMPVLDAAGAADAGAGRDAARRAGAGALPGRRGAHGRASRPHPGRGERPVRRARRRRTDAGARRRRWPDGSRTSACRTGRPVGAYCGSGVTAASVVLALEVAGVTSAEAPAGLYVGSWSEWSGDPDRPVATGPEPG